jgi:hypothetical protein
MRTRVALYLSAAIVLGCSVWWWDFSRPHVYRHAVSPEGTWSVTVLRQRVPPYVEGVDVIVRAQDLRGRVLYHEKIDNRDLWPDVDDRYPEVSIDERTARIGPGYPDGEAEGYFVLRKAELDHGRD